MANRCHARLERYYSNSLVPANLDARVVSAELAVDSSLPDNTAGALAATNLQMGGSRIHCQGYTVKGTLCQGLGEGEQDTVFDKEKEEEVDIHQSRHIPVDDPTPEESFASFADGGSIVDSG